MGVFEITMLATFGVLAAAVCYLLVAKVRADRKLRAALNALPAGIALYDRHDRLYLWNKPYQDITGMGGKTLSKGLRFREILKEDLRTGHYAEATGREEEWLEERMALRAKCEGSREQDLKDGRWLSVADRRSPDGGTVSVCMDVTEVKRGADSLKLMFDNNPVPMWLWEGKRALKIIDLNQAALDHLGYTRDEIAGLTVFDLLSPEERPALNAMVQSGMKRPYYSGRVWRPRHKDGTLRFAVPYIHLLPEVDGEPRYVAAIVDVTDRVKVEEDLRRNGQELAKALDEARAAGRAKDEFLAAVSHELRTPLNAVIGFSEIMKAEYLGSLGNDTYREYAANIRSSGAHLLSVINDILDLTKLSAGQMELYPEDFSTEEMLDDCVAVVRLKAGAENIGIETHCDPAASGMHGDRKRIRQIVLNLLSNAVKFTPAGGKVFLSVERRGMQTAIIVRDTGIGMSPEQIPKALERFGQIDSSLSRKYEGTGLGLPLTKQLAELHGGTLAIESAPGQGTTVTVTLGPASLRQVA